MPSFVDWERVEAEYRAGQLSVREIAKQAGLSEGAVRKRAKAGKWQRSLAEKVREAVREKLVRTSCTQSSRTRTDDEIVEDTAERGVALVRSHQKSLSRANSIVDKLLDELESETDDRVQIEEDIEAETLRDKNPMRRNAMLKAVSLPSRAQTARELSATLKNLIPLERQAFGLDEGPSADGITIKITPADADL